MKRNFLLFILLLFCCLPLTPQKNVDPSRSAYDDLQKANRLYALENPSPESDSLALAFFTSYIETASLINPSDSLLADALIKSANIHQGYQRFSTANALYFQALNRAYPLPLIRYEAWLYLGSSHYFDGRIDSAKFYLEKAAHEALQANKKMRLPEQDRLYNSLGAIYFETGNYTQALNYFLLAKTVTAPGVIGYRDLITGIESNIANCFMKMNRHDTAIRILQTLDPGATQKNIVRQNMAHAWFELGQYDSAMHIYASLPDLTGRNRVIVLNNIGRMQMAKGDWRLAERTLDSAIAENRISAAYIRNKEEALTYLYRGELAAKLGLLEEALTWINEGIRELHPGFSPRHWIENPENISLSTSPVTLFGLLQKKAELLYAESQKAKKKEYLLAAMDTYLKTLETGIFIRLNFDNDEAKLFFNNWNKSLFAAALKVAYTCSESGLSYADEVLQILENYKGTILSQHRQNLQLKSNAIIPDSIRLREQELKELLAYYLSRINQSSTEAEITDLQKKQLEVQVALSRIHGIYENAPGYRRQRNEILHDQITASRMQEELPSGATLLHYFHSDSLIYVLAISKNRIDIAEMKWLGPIRDDLNLYLQSLNDQTEGQRFVGRKQSENLYAALLQPVEKVFRNSSRLFIIPDGPLFQLPFESLSTGSAVQDYLVHTYEISYHYSAGLLFQHPGSLPADWKNLDAAGFAPFHSENEVLSDWPNLPRSLEEIPGHFNVLYDKAAIKDSFVSLANRYALIHLATHASLGDAPGQQFIQFYPLQGSIASQRLYIPEIYNLDLRHARLIILSACETSGGNPISGEGLLSLSRAFIYAGAEGIIATLWKTEDKIASYLMKKLHHYLQRQYEPARALHLAKRDLLNDPSISVRYKTPNYWSNFIFVGKAAGHPSKRQSPFSWLLILPAICAILFGIGLLLKHRKTISTNPNES